MQDFGHAQLVEAEAIGEPGQRTFRLRVMSGPKSASLWMEKEQLAALTLAIRQLLEQTPESDTDQPEPAPPADPFPETPGLDFKIGRLGIGYDEANHMLVIFAYTMEEAEDSDTPAFSCHVSRNQCRTFADRAEEIVSAGRPICLVCGGPIEATGHKCLRRNGYDERPPSLKDEDD